MSDIVLPPSYSALDAVRDAGITIASDGAEYKRIVKYDPVDATTNPSLVFAAVSTPQYSHLIEHAATFALVRSPSATVEEQTELALDHLLVQIAVEILCIVPGRVSISVDPRLGFSYKSILSKSRALIKLVDELHIPRERILVKIPATAEGIHAAHTLEKDDGIHTNLTLIFSLVQAIACAQAGVSVVSPFIGRVKDWWSARAIASGIADGLENQPLKDHPGITLVHRIKEAYTWHGYSTQIMAAGFRKPEEIVELSRFGSKGGPDLVTLPPELLEGLMNMEGSKNLGRNFSESVNSESSTPVPVYFTADGPTEEGSATFDHDSRKEAISLDKVPEGLTKFSVDAVKLEKTVRDAIEKLSQARLSDVGSATTDVFKETVERLGRASGEVLRRSVSVN